MKDSEWSGLSKVPDEVIIKQLRQELGKVNAYIQELEYKLLDHKPKNSEFTIQQQWQALTKEERNLLKKEIADSFLLSHYQSELSRSKEKCKSLEKKYFKLINDYVILSNKLRDYEKLLNGVV